MSEDVFSFLQIGTQGGSTTAPGAAAAAAFQYPIADIIHPDLELGVAYPVLHHGRNARNLGGSGYHGVRRAGVTVPSEMRYEDLMAILELIYAGGVTPTGTGPYTWLYPFEADAPTVIPATIQIGNSDLSAAQARLTSALVASMTMGFSAVTAGQASPWTMSAELVAFNREVSALTADLDPVANPLETIQGHLTRFYEGTVATAFGSLAEIASSIKSCSITATRGWIPRAYGSASDLPTKFGLPTDMSNATIELVVAVSATAKTDLHDVWNTSGGTSLGERRIRLQASGSGSKKFTVDGRIGLFAVPWDDEDGERVYKITGEFADDDTLDASHTIEIVNGIDALPVAA